MASETKWSVNALTVAFPEELRAARQWVVWKREPRNPEQPMGDQAKVPYQARNVGRRAKTDDEGTWASFEEAVTAYTRGGDEVSGVGFVFTAADPWVFVDLDGCLTEKWPAAYVEWLVDTVLRSWTERSQSGNGLHVIVRAGSVEREKKVGKGAKGASVAALPCEVYPRGHFVALTGDVWRTYAIEERQGEIDGLLRTLDVYQQALVGLNAKGEKADEVARLWLGEQAADGEKDASGEDFELARWLVRLAHGDEEVAGWLMRMSWRWRPKWDEQRRSRNENERGVIDRRFAPDAGLTYLETTVGKACQGWREARRGGEDAEHALGVDVARVFKEAPFTGLGDVECCVAAWGERYRRNKTRECDLVWSDVAGWQVDECGTWLWERVAEVVRGRGALASTMDEPEATALRAHAMRAESETHRELIAKGLRSKLAVSEARIDMRAELVGVQNGVVNLETGEWRAACPDDLVTRRLGVAFDAGAECPRWEKFIDEVFEGDGETIEFVQRALGYSLTTSLEEQCLFLCIGDGANGKSLFLNTVASVFGDYAGRAAFSMFSHEGGGASEEVARLKGVRLLTIIEADTDRRLAEAKVKSATGGDMLVASHKYGHVFEYLPVFTVWLAMNRQPKIVGTDNGVWRRIRLIEFKRTFMGDAADKQLGKVLADERAGILNWLLVGLRKWRAGGLPVARRIEEATAEYRQESDVVQVWASELLRAKDGGKVSCHLAYQSYLAWAKDRREYEMSMTAWGRRMAELKYVKVKGGRGTGRAGRNLWFLMDVELDDDALAEMTKL